ncbi:hypothetical protein NCS55_01269000 [Fusarium keratoplasticum]|nr:hypothetical protein NCS55_01269000 [Fusarium keratoplasticum]
MDPTRDIRNLYNATRAKVIMTSLLQDRPPPDNVDKEVGFRTYGLDCLVIVVRMLYSVMLPIYATTDDRSEAAEARNPLLRLAWQKFSYEDGACLEMARVKSEVLEAFEADDHDLFEPEFAYLVRSPLMEETLWCRPEYQLFQPDLRWSGSEWQTRSFTKAESAEMNVIRVTNGDATFQQQVDEIFGRMKHFDGSEIIRMCNEPCIIRVMYEVVPEDEPFPFSTIKNINVPIPEIETFRYTPAARRSCYTLVAVVRLHEDSGGDYDRVRTDSPMAEQLILLPSIAVLRGGSWSLESKEKSAVSFMLFYARTDNQEPHPWWEEHTREPESLRAELDAMKGRGD